MREYWKTIGSGFMATLFALFVVGLPWFAIRSDHVRQTQVQAAYLAELSGYPGKETNPMRKSNLVQELVAITEWKAETNADNIENYLRGWFRLMKNTYVHDPGGYIVRLIQEMPGAIRISLQGDTQHAQMLEEKWLQTRNVSFFPYGVTLMLVFLVGTVLTIVIAAPWYEK